MYRNLQSFLLLVLSLFMSSNHISAESRNLKLWYDKPADVNVADSPLIWDDDPEWLRALPLGNGSLGAMVFGGVARERIQLNEESLWSGGPADNNNPKSASYYLKVRSLLNEGRYKEACELTDTTLICSGEGSGHGNGKSVPYGCYQTLGDLWFDFHRTSPYNGYRKELDLEKAMVEISYQQDGIEFNRSMFISAPDQVMVIRFTADRKNSISFDCGMSRPERYRTFVENKQLVMTGCMENGSGEDGMKYMVRLEVVPKGNKAKISYGTNDIKVENAEEVLVFLSASTDYILSYPTYKGRHYRSITKQNIKKASSKTWSQLLKSHIAEYQGYFDRASFSLSSEKSFDAIPTDRRLDNFRNGCEGDLKLYELLFSYGRYLLISSSRPETLPANLQGIWANKLQTAWNGDYHTDINVQMNYWPAEVSNLSDLHIPYFNLLKSLVEPGTETAKVQYGLDGWIVHPITNVWGYTAPGEYPGWGLHIGATAWCCQHIAEHYRFTKDKKFLETMYPVIKGAAQFYLGWLSRDAKTNLLVSGPATSPENSFYTEDGEKCYLSMGPAHDQQTIWQLFHDVEFIASELGIDDDFIKSIHDARESLLPTRIGKDGRIMEWAEEFKEADPGHRHISHMFAFYPGSQFNMIQSGDYVQAAKKSIEYRIEHSSGDVHQIANTGWSCAWLINLYARFHEAEHAKQCIDNILKNSLCPNMFTLAPPFQIDALFGTTAGIAEMLVQSHVFDGKDYIVELLPAIPSSWKDGEFKGLRVRGGFEVDLKWKDSELISAAIKSVAGSNVKIKYKGKVLRIEDMKPGQTSTLENLERKPNVE